MEFVIAYITAKDHEEAASIGRRLVEARLAACVNILDGMESIYWWEGKVDSSREAVLLAKTTQDKLPALTAEVKARHSYQTPCVISWKLGEGNPAYFAWLADSLNSSVR